MPSSGRFIKPRHYVLRMLHDFGNGKAKLKKKEAEALKEVEEHFLMVFEINKNEDDDASDTLEGALLDMKNYLIVRGLLEENED